jgi:hypothetical protein
MTEAKELIAQLKEYAREPAGPVLLTVCLLIWIGVVYVISK